MDSPALRDLQKDFFRCVAEPIDSRSGISTSPLRGIIRAAGDLGANGGLAIYRSMYFSRHLDVLRADYPSVATSLGHRFDAVARRYVIERPLSQPSIQEVSEGFPDFLERELIGRPEVADEARVERAKLEVFAEADGEPLSLESLRGVPPEAWSTLLLRPIDALRVVTRVWTRDGERPVPRPRVVRVWRQGFEIFEASADLREARALDALRAGGTTLSEIGEILGQDVSAEDAARDAAALLLRWIDDGIVYSDAVQ